MRYLGVDFGLRKIGLAISEGELVSLFGIIYVKDKEDAVNKIRDIVKREGIDQLVVGLPESGIRSAVLKFITQLKLEIPVETIEETLTSQKAKEQMIELGIKRKKRREEDAYSASEILQNYLDNKKSARHG